MALGANAENEEERSLRDDLAAGLADIEAREAAQVSDDDTSAEPVIETPKTELETGTDPSADRGDGRDASGKFVKKGGEGPEAAAPAAAEEPQVQTEATVEVPEAPAATAEDQAPKSWRADEQKVWASLDPVAKSAILRREAEAARLAGANDSERMFGREMADIFRPHIQEIEASGANPQVALKTLLANHNALRSNNPQEKYGTAVRLLQEYGIDPSQLAQIQMPDQTVTALQRQIAELQQRLSNPQAQNFAPLPPSAEDASILSEIEAFREDPAHPHFDAVQPIMAQLLETDAAPDLESAYQAAVAMSPALRSTAQPAPQRTQQEDKTAAARRASASVSGSPGPTGNPTPLTLRDELAEGLRSAGFSV